MIARVEYRGCVFSIKSQLGTKQKGAFIEGVHLWKVYLWRVDCILKFELLLSKILCDYLKNFL